MKIKGIFLLYRSLQALALPALLFYWLLRGLRNRAWFGTLPQRLGFLPHSFKQTIPGAIWLHAVSVGEVVACLALVRSLRERLPRVPVFVSVSTLAGRATANAKLRGLAEVFYAPVDYAFAVRRVLRTLRPSVVAIAETEIWPNLFRETTRTRAALLLVNGRISDRAFPRYRRLHWFFRCVLPLADAVLVQSEAMRERFMAAGTPGDRVEICGNLKYDFQPQDAGPDSPVRAFLAALSPDRVWIAASTMPPAQPGDPDEDDVVIQAFRHLAGVALVLAPRRPERFDVAAAKLRAAGVPFVRRSRMEAVPGARVLLLDTIGELSGIFSLADVVFMGGTLASRGGHNILEPAAFAKPVIVGPHMENFQEIADEFRASRALVEIGAPSELAGAVRSVLADSLGAAEVGRRAQACASARRGAAARTLDCILTAHKAAFACYRPAQPWLAVATPLALLWMAAGERRLRRTRPRSLPVPVVSIGNITMGGTGKTPFVLFLAERLRGAGRSPGILTRGYGRRSPESHVSAGPGADIAVEHSGDEPQMFLRARVASVGIGADRFRTGTMLVKQYDADVLLLDDGFQHTRVARAADIVLIDALNPFGGCRIFPAGRLREPLRNLRRADILVITRSDYSRSVPAIEARLRRYNHRAPIFYARVEPRAWIEHQTGVRLPLDALPALRAGAFCGLGNPQSFWSTLEALGIDAVERVEFGDHHRYTPGELRRTAQLLRQAGAEIALTTEKDALNLCEDCESIIEPMRIYWLEIGTAVDREDDFLAAVQSRFP